jgi:hypothetical protein
MPVAENVFGPFIHVHRFVVRSYFHNEELSPLPWLTPPNIQKLPAESFHEAGSYTPGGTVVSAGTPWVPKTPVEFGTASPCIHVHMPPWAYCAKEATEKIVTSMYLPMDRLIAKTSRKVRRVYFRQPIRPSTPQ